MCNGVVLATLRLGYPRKLLNVVADTEIFGNWKGWYGNNVILLQELENKAIESIQTQIKPFKCMSRIVDLQQNSVAACCMPWTTVETSTTASGGKEAWLHPSVRHLPSLLWQWTSSISKGEKKNQKKYHFLPLTTEKVYGFYLGKLVCLLKKKEWKFFHPVKPNFTLYQGPFFPDDSSEIQINQSKISTSWLRVFFCAFLL